MGQSSRLTPQAPHSPRLETGGAFCFLSKCSEWLSLAQLRMNVKIKNDYPHYLVLLGDLKRVAFSPFFMQPKPNNTKFVEGIVSVAHVSISETISLAVEQNVNTRSHFG